MDRFLTYLEPAEETALLEGAPIKTFEKGEVVVEQNKPMQAIYVIERGSVRVERDDGTKMIDLAILAMGEFFGEISFVDGAPTSARIIAREATQVRVLTPELVSTVGQTNPTFDSRFYKSIAAILADRLRKTSLNVYV